MVHTDSPISLTASIYDEESKAREIRINVTVFTLPKSEVSIIKVMIEKIKCALITNINRQTK